MEYMTRGYTLLANLQIHSQRQEGWQHRTLNGEVLRQAIEVCGEQVPKGISSFLHWNAEGYEFLI